MSSRYRLQVVHIDTGEIAKGWEPGDHVETDIALELAKRIKDKGVGLFRTEKHVMADVVAAVGEMLLDLKRRV